MSNDHRRQNRRGTSGVGSQSMHGANPDAAFSFHERSLALVPYSRPEALSSRGSDYAASNVTGYRRCLDVPGLPDRTFFDSKSSHSSYGGRVSAVSEKRGRSYRRNADAYPSAANKGLISRSRKDSVIGMEIVRYGADEWEDDDDTVVPEDSISHVSLNRPRLSRQSQGSYRSGGREVYERRNGAGGGYRSQQYGGDDMSMFESSKEFYPDRGYDVVERRPRWG